MRLLLVFSTKVQEEENRRYFTDDFPEVKKIVEGGVITKPQNDYDLSRYVCYLIVQNRHVLQSIHTGKKLLSTLMNWTKITEDSLGHVLDYMSDIISKAINK